MPIASERSCACRVASLAAPTRRSSVASAHPKPGYQRGEARAGHFHAGYASTHHLLFKGLQYPSRPVFIPAQACFIMHWTAPALRCQGFFPGSKPSGLPRAQEASERRWRRWRLASSRRVSLRRVSSRRTVLTRRFVLLLIVFSFFKVPAEPCRTT